LTTIDDVSKTLLSQLEEFFVSYNKQRGKRFKIAGTGGPRKAIELLKAGSKRRKSENDR
jgi:inorganic pyrophosphatase